MKYSLHLLTILSILFASNSLLEENYFEIKDFDGLIFNDKEFEIHDEFIKIVIPNEFIIYNIEVTLKADTEFLFALSNDLIQNNLNENNLLKTKETMFHLFEEISKNSANNELKNTLYLNIKEPERHKVTLKMKKLTEPFKATTISKEDCEIVKSTLKKLMENTYIFLDYAKNPKQPEGFPNYFEKVDFIADLDNIKTENRETLDFYRDIKEALGKFKDLHLNILYNEYIKSSYCLPFSFIIKENEQNIPKLYIYKNNCFDLFPEEKRNAIELLLDKAITSINGKDPFDYIQNFVGNKFIQVKNRHATFNMHLNDHNVDNPNLAESPLLESELTDIEFIFEGEGNSITLSYILFTPNENTFTKEFNKFFDEEIEKAKKKDIVKLPNVFDVQKKFLLSKNIQNEKEKEKEKEKNNLEWDVEFIDDDEKIKFKCRIDHVYGVNVMYQNTFDFENLENARYKMLFCANLFASNEYPIIIIESQNNGGIIYFSSIMTELIQPLFEHKEYISFKPTDDIYDLNFKYSKVKTCETSGLKQNKEKETDDYGEGITHIRTPIYNILVKENRIALDNLRKSRISLGIPRSPTQILIFTDGFSFSAGSLLIKGFQKDGSAIIAGYMGNPNIKGTDEFDASQSPSQVHDFKDTEYYKTLKEKGFEIEGVTIGETFLNPHEKNQVPKEYQLNPVDERVNIYQTYSDDIYDDFILEGLSIFEKYQTQCNQKNKKLTLFTTDCLNIEEHTHGGKVCDDNGKWSDECVPVYCDLGYYFDYYTKKCEEEICLKDKGKEDGNNKGNIDNINWMILAIFILSILV